MNGHTEAPDGVRSAIVFMGSRYDSDSCRQTYEGSPFCNGGKAIKVFKLKRVTSFFQLKF